MEQSKLTTLISNKSVRTEQLPRYRYVVYFLFWVGVYGMIMPFCSVGSPSGCLLIYLLILGLLYQPGYFIRGPRAKRSNYAAESDMKVQ